MYQITAPTLTHALTAGTNYRSKLAMTFQQKRPKHPHHQHNNHNNRGNKKETSFPITTIHQTLHCFCQMHTLLMLLIEPRTALIEYTEKSLSHFLSPI